MMKQVIILGASDRATAAAIRLFRSGFAVIIVEKDLPFNLYYTRTFSRVVQSGYALLDAVPARTVANAVESELISEKIKIEEYAPFAIANREIPLILESEVNNKVFEPADYVLVTDDVLFAKTSSFISEKSVLIGFDDSQVDCLYSIATLSPLTGMVRYPFLDERLGDHDPVKQKAFCRVHLPLEGLFVAMKQINDHVQEKEELARINDIPILAPESGRLVGILNSGILVPSGTDFAEIAPFHSSAYGHLIPTEAWAIAGAVLEVILYDMNLNRSL
jgi:xanthine dehydrogenase accessory factor